MKGEKVKIVFESWIKRRIREDQQFMLNKSRKSLDILKDSKDVLNECYYESQKFQNLKSEK